MILGICESPEILKVFMVIKVIIKIIKIIVPILLLVSAALTFTKAVANGENKKAMQSVIRKCIAALVIFMVPTLIGIISNLTSGGYSGALNCIKNASTENINKIIVADAEKYVELVKKSKNRSDLYNARVAIQKITDSEKYNYYEKQLNEVETEIVREEASKYQQTIGDFVSTDAGWWWPVGSKETTAIDGKLFAKGSPSATRLTAYFGGNDSVHQGLGGGHGAIDIGAGRGSNVIASKSGTVVYPTRGARIDYPDSYIKPDSNGKYNCRGLIANYVIIDHGNGMKTQYSHLYKNTITVKAGDHVEQGQVIGLSGSSGCSTGPHLHFQMELNGKRVDPLKYVSSSNPRPQ